MPEADHLIFNKVQNLKNEGHNSREVARMMNLSLERVNDMWTSCEHCQHATTKVIIKK